MEINVGSRLKWRGRDVVCTSILSQRETCFAPADSIEIQSNINRPENVKYLNTDIGEFDQGDLVTFDFMKLELTEIGKGLFYIYNRYSVKREGLNGPEGLESSDWKTTDAAPKTDRPGHQGGESAWSKGIGKDGAALDRYGRGREEGTRVYTASG